MGDGETRRLRLGLIRTTAGRWTRGKNKDLTARADPSQTVAKTTIRREPSLGLIEYQDLGQLSTRSKRSEIIMQEQDFTTRDGPYG